MSHQVCVAHSRRVVVTRTSLIHRNGNGSKCNSDTVVSGKFAHRVKDIQTQMAIESAFVVPKVEFTGRVIDVKIEEDPGVRLLRSIFSNEDEFEDEGYFGGDV